MKCPICKKDALFVGVHDDEGNYHGLVGCDYESNPWSGLSYALHHDGWGECPLCTDGEYGPMGGMLFDTAEEAINALTPQNEPLTVEQLWDVDGEPVWIKRLKGLSVCDTGWAVVDVCPNQIRVWWFGSEVEDEPSEKDYGETWLAYRRPPEGEEDT